MPLANPTKLRTALACLLFVVAAVAGLVAATPDSELKLVIVLTRHGVRSPLQTNEILGKFAAEPWPVWHVAPGILTPHGRQEMVMMGGYYRDRFVAEGLLTGKADVDAAQVYFRSDNDQRTQESGRALAAGLLPGSPAPDLHTRPPGQADALFQFVKAHPALPDRNLAVASLNGRIGNDPAAALAAHQTEFSLLEQVLCGPSGTPPPGKTGLLDLPVSVQAGSADHTVGFEGPLHTGMSIVDALQLEYAEGLPMSDVGWGRMTPAMLTQLLRLHALYFDLTQGTFYPAQVQASGLAQHYLATIEQAVSGQVVEGAFGTPGQKLVVVMGHDTNLINLGGLLGLNWQVPGAADNPVLPGGALLVELRQRTADQRWLVRVSYVGQTLEQIRTLTPLSLEHPPAIAPIFIPDCSAATPGFDAPLEKFEALLYRVIDPKFVPPGMP